MDSPIPRVLCRSSRPACLVLAVLILGPGTDAAPAVIRRDGWSFERSSFTWAPWAKPDQEKARGTLGSLKGWTEYDVEIPRAGWYELWLGGAPPEWPRDLFVDGKPVLRLCVSGDEDKVKARSRNEPTFKEANLFLLRGRHSLRFRRLGFPGVLPSVWELREAGDDPAARMRGSIDGPPITAPGDTVKLILYASPKSATRYELMVRNEVTEQVTEVAAVDVEPTAEPVTREVPFSIQEAGLYSLVAKIGDRLLRPSDMKAGRLLVAPAPAPPKLREIKGLELASMFTNGAVLQCDRPLPVWGWAKAGDTVTVSFPGQSKSAVAEPNGRWSVTLDALPASKKPAVLTVASRIEGQTLTIEDVLVGEVWLLSGQSNMGGPLLTCTGGREAAESADFAPVRLFGVHARTGPDGRPEVQPGGWSQALSGGNAERLKHWVGIQFGFGTDLFRALDVPVGLIAAARGGTKISAWTSLETQRSEPTFRAMLDALDAETSDWSPQRRHVNSLASAVAKWRRESAKDAETNSPAPKLPRLVADLADRNTPACNYDSLVEPTAPFAIRGVLWYQGESDGGMAVAYRTRFPAMIDDWRRLWQNDSMPFLFVQLAMTNGKPHEGPPSDRCAMAELREAQLLTLSVPHTAMVVSHDLPGPGDDVHYHNKIPVGQRLALAALSTVYGRDVEHSGPVYRDMTVEGGRVRLSFDHLGGGLVARSGDLGGFAIAGEDRVFHWANARINGDTVVVESKAVANPVAARYCWVANRCGANLFSRAGLPAPSFRTDDWPLSTKGVMFMPRD